MPDATTIAPIDTRLKINIENLLTKEKSALIDWGFIVHLKELRERLVIGDLSAATEFFAIYKFNE